MSKKNLFHSVSLFSPLPSLGLMCLLGFYFASILLKLTTTMTRISQLQTAAYQPFAITAHHELAKLYMQTQTLVAAQKELQLADESLLVMHTPQVLGLASDINALQQQLREKPQQLQKEQDYWLGLTQAYPNYRDAWVQLWYLASSANNNEAADFYKQQALQLDPNFQFPASTLNIFHRK